LPVPRQAISAGEKFGQCQAFLGTSRQWWWKVVVMGSSVKSEEKWAGKYASIAPAWRRAWQEVIPFFAFDPAIRKIIYTTNAIESLNRVIRKSIKTRGSFPTDDAATKLIYLAIRNFEKDGRNVREWFAARNQFAIMFEERFNA